MSTSQPVQTRSRRERPLSFAFLSSIVSLLAVFVASSAPIPLYNTYRAEDGLSNADISLAIVVYGLSVLAALLFMGRVSNYLGRRATAIASLLLLIVGCALFLNVHEAGTLLVARTLMGLGAGIASSNLTAYSVDAAPAKTSALAAIATSQLPMLGLAIGAVLSGGLVELGFAPRQLSYIFSGAMLAASVALIALSPETAPRKPGVWRSLRPTLAIPARLLPLLPVATAVYLATWATGAFFQAFVPALVSDELQTRSPLVLGLVFASYMASSAVGAALSTRLSPAAAQRAGMLAFLAGMVGIVFAIVTGALLAFVIATIVAGASQGVAISAATRALLSGAMLSERAPILSVIYLVSYTATVLPSLLAGQLSNVFTLPQIAVGYGILAAVATLVTLVAAKNPVPENRTLRAPNSATAPTTH
ncbi:MFS transporter [Microbacterium sp. NPDC089318]